MRTRPASPGDLPALERNVAAGFETYRAFAPAGWEPPVVPVEAQLALPGVWCLVAESDDAVVVVVAHVLFGPGLASRAPGAARIAGLAHLYHLFVLEPWWGSGIARDLMAAAVAEMARQGFGEARLFTPAGQARARRFYVREGWREAGAPHHDPGLDFDVVELRRTLGDVA